MWGVVPAAGRGTRIQPLAFSKELLPVGIRTEGGVDRPMAVSEYVVERMLRAGVTKLCFVIAPGKSDIVGYFGGSVRGADVCYVVQDRPLGLCDALFRALPFIAGDERVCFGLPDTIWFPEDGLLSIMSHPLEFLLFPVDEPRLFDAVEVDADGNVLSIQVKSPAAKSNLVWGAFAADAGVLRELHALWHEREASDEYLGTLVNAYLARGGTARASAAGRRYVDVGTLHGYREATRLLEDHHSPWDGTALDWEEHERNTEPMSVLSIGDP